MTADREQHDELRELLWLLEEGSISAEGIARIDELVCNDTNLLQSYIEHLQLFSDLRLGATNCRIAETLDRVFGGEERATDAAMPSERGVAFPLPAFIIHHSSFSIQHSGLGGVLFSYLTAALILGTALTVAWVWKMPDYTQVAVHRAAPSVERRQPRELGQQVRFVGRITGMVDCEWADAATAVPGRVAVPLGRKYALKAGFLEITYNTGAKVILQGPCNYEVESPAGGYLSVGKLTARVEKKVESRESRVESNQTTAKTRATNHSQLSTLDSRLFSVRTPTAIVTDLGTEFGVVVEASGATETHVFEGLVETRVVGGNGEPSAPVRLEANQSVRVDAVQGQSPALRFTPVSANVFARKMPRRASIEVFNTGVGVGPGEADQHWQIAAVSNDPAFQARAAVVTTIFPGNWVGGNAGRSQWISMVAGTGAANHVVYTFRTTFELTDVAPDTAVLRGRFVVDNHVRSIRLNGHEVSVPEHEHDGSFDHFVRFAITNGFVAGNNVLEFDVENGTPGCKEADSPMGLRVELEASAHSRQ